MGTKASRKVVQQVAKIVNEKVFAGDDGAAKVIEYDGRWVVYAESGEWTYGREAVQEVMDSLKLDWFVEPVNGSVLGVYER